jgi:hypothetical protein
MPRHRLSWPTSSGASRGTSSFPNSNRAWKPAGLRNSCTRGGRNAPHGHVIDRPRG